MPRKKGSVVVTFTFDGKRFSASGKTKKEAIENAALKKRLLEEGSVVIESGMLMRNWVEVCYRDYKTGCAEITKQKEQEKAQKWIVDTIGNKPLKSIKNDDLQKIMNRMDGYSEDHIKKVHRIMVWLFDIAVENGLINKNPALKLRRPKGTKRTRRSITEAERAVILEVADTDPRFLLFLFMLFCGCRPSEAAELQGRDVILEDGKPLLHIRGTKTKNSDRFVPIDQYLYARIPKTKKFEYIVTRTDGEPMDAPARAKLWTKFKRELNIAMGARVYRNQVMPPYPVAPDLEPYCLRHTFCTDLQRKGVDIRVAQVLMGHGSITMTANIYTHIDSKEVAKQMLEQGDQNDQNIIKMSSLMSSRLA